MQANVVSVIPPKVEKLCEVCEKPLEQVSRVVADVWERSFGFISDKNRLHVYWETVPHDQCADEIERRNEQRRKEREEQDREKERAQYLSSLKWMYENKPLLPFNAREKTFENYLVADEDKQSIRLIESWRPGDRFGLFIMGPAGSGKSHLLQSIFNKVVSNQDVFSSLGSKNFSWFPVSLGLDQIRSEMSDNKESTRNQMRNSSLLFVDDLGAENATDWSREQLYQLFDYRLSKGLPTFISTNLTSEEVKLRYHERLMSRIKEMCVIVQLKGRDRRTDKMKENIQTLKERLK